MNYKVAEIMYGKHHVILDSSQVLGCYDHEIEIRVLVNQLTNIGWLWKCERIHKIGIQEIDDKDRITLRKGKRYFKVLARKLLKDGELDLSKIRNDE